MLNLLDTLHDPAKPHDERWEHMERAVLSDASGGSMRTLYSATSRHSFEVGRVYAQPTASGSAQTRAGAQLCTNAVVAQEEALRDALFARIYEQLASQECRLNNNSS